MISASDSISKGALDVKVPEVETDEEFKLLNQNFNQMLALTPNSSAYLGLIATPFCYIKCAREDVFSIFY